MHPPATMPQVAIIGSLTELRIKLNLTRNGAKEQRAKAQEDGEKEKTENTKAPQSSGAHA